MSGITWDPEMPSLEERLLINRDTDLTWSSSVVQGTLYLVAEYADGKKVTVHAMAPKPEQEGVLIEQLKPVVMAWFGPFQGPTE